MSGHAKSDLPGPFDKDKEALLNNDNNTAHRSPVAGVIARDGAPSLPDTTVLLGIRTTAVATTATPAGANTAATGLAATAAAGNAAAAGSAAARNVLRRSFAAAASGATCE